MFIRVDPSRAAPMYAQIVEGVSTLIGRRVLRSGERLPSVRDLAVSLRVNRNTVAKAYAALEATGWLETRVGQGTFVAPGTRPLPAGEAWRKLETHIERLLVEASRLGVPVDAVAERVRARAESFMTSDDERTPAEVNG